MAMREIVLDTETTGLDPKSGHRIVELGCIELTNHMPNGNTFHEYLNPERDMPSDAFDVHGLSTEFLAGHKLFGEIAEQFLHFIGDAALVIHNARFDISFLNAELARLKLPGLDINRAIDTVALARRKFPGAPVNLDALCRRFDIDNAGRAKHGALLDSELLAEVYLELIGGRQPGLGLAGPARAETVSANASRETKQPRAHAPDGAELEAHSKFVESLNNPIWRD
jgi:DNA polymerase III subunit epsilon